MVLAETCSKKSEGLGRVGFYFSKFEAPLGYFSKYFGSWQSSNPAVLACLAGVCWLGG